MADERNRWNDEALNQLARRVDDMTSLLDEFRQETNRSLRALTRKRKNGKLEPAPGGLGLATWISLIGIIVVPIVVAILTTSGGH